MKEIATRAAARDDRGSDPSPSAAEINTDLTRGVLQTGWDWWATLGFFAAVFGWATLVFAYQIYDGMGAYGNNRPDLLGRCRSSTSSSGRASRFRGR